MKVAIVGTSRLEEGKEKYDAMHHIGLILHKYPNAEFITGDAEGIDTLVRLVLSPQCKVTMVKALSKHWEGKHGFKSRNIKIAEMADIVYSIATKKIKDRRCYHCDEQNHDRTGGCWTRRFALDKLGKAGHTLLI